LGLLFFVLLALLGLGIEEPNVEAQRYGKEHGPDSSSKHPTSGRTALNAADECVELIAFHHSPPMSNN
jgi:hypothetical protein